MADIDVRSVSRELLSPERIKKPHIKRWNGGDGWYRRLPKQRVESICCFGVEAEVKSVFVALVVTNGEGYLKRFDASRARHNQHQDHHHCSNHDLITLASKCSRHDTESYLYDDVGIPPSSR